MSIFQNMARVATVLALATWGVAAQAQAQAQEVKPVEPAAVQGNKAQAGVAATLPNGDRNYPTGVVPVPPKPKKERLTGAKLGDKAAIKAKAKAEAVQGQ